MRALFFKNTYFSQPIFYSLMSDPDSFLQLVKARRTIRSSFLSKPVSSDDIKFVLEAARWAPSGHNAQPWEFIVVEEEELKVEISESTMQVYEELMSDEAKLRKTFGSYYKWFHLDPSKGDGLYTDKPTVYVKDTYTPSELESLRDRAEDYCKSIRESPMLLITLLDKGKPPPNISGGLISLVSMGAALQNIRLAATARGIGCQDLARPIDTPEGKKRLKQILGVPEEFMIVSVFRMGYIDPEATHAYKSGFRRPLETLIHLNKF